MPLQTDHAVQEFVRKNPGKPKLDHESLTRSPDLPPDLMALIGAGTDAASTYAFLKQSEPKPGEIWARPGQRSEDNAFLSGHGPAGTALGVLGSSLGGLGLSKLLGKISPGLSKTLVANQGAQSLGMGLENLSNTEGSSVDNVNRKITTAVRRKK